MLLELLGLLFLAITGTIATYWLTGGFFACEIETIEGTKKV